MRRLLPAENLWSFFDSRRSLYYTGSGKLKEAKGPALMKFELAGFFISTVALARWLAIGIEREAV
jgi:hypothetical protein